ncbi:HEAT repeat domain-containing protein [Paenibacillus sp.]|uniref:HEAT repeat domain-containing protein n=1 Tax=Paenibacillus sp. TaxID=58172 RepID=UPI002D2504F9|nr:HEAT repeat domain-containing protein [Paenibacillus sp.]HZG58538.1 HEAT repeat domain-containing protein [Paenibacillus sp.]
MNDRLLRWAGVKPEDHRKLFALGPIFFLCGIAEMLTFNGYVTLFNERLGSEYLPYVYMAEAVILPVEAWLLSWLTGKLTKPQLMRAMFLILFAVVAVNAAVLLCFRLTGAEVRWYYPFLFLSSSFVVRQQTILLWSLAIDLCPTQQSKRLMPLFVSGAASGGIVAGLLALGVSPLLGPDAVYVLAPLFLLAGAPNYWKAIHRYLVPLTLKATGSGDGETDINASTYYYKKSFTWPYMLVAMAVMTAMPALYFLMEYEFLNVTRAIYTNESEFGAFFGLVTALLFTLALALQAFSNRISAWIGPSNMLVAISAVFGAGFLLVALSLPTPVILYAISLSYMFYYLLLYYFAEPANQMYFKLLPISQRDGFRYVVQGVSASAGIALGALLQWLHAGLGMDLRTLAWVGAAAAGGLVLLARYGRQLYMRELIRSVQSMTAADGVSADAFREFSRHARFPALLAEMLDHPNDYGREVALELIRRYRPGGFEPKLLQLLTHPSSRLRMAALRALDASAAGPEALSRVAALLDDPDHHVRAEAIRLMGRANAAVGDAARWVRTKLQDDHPLVLAEAVKALFLLKDEASFGACCERIERLLQEGGESAVAIVNAVGELKLDRYLPEVVRLLQDPSPALRAAAIESLGLLRHTPAVPLLLEHLERAEPMLQEATKDAWIRMGDDIVPPLLAALPDAPPRVWAVAVRTLASMLSEDGCRQSLVPEAVRMLQSLWSNRPLPAALRARADDGFAGIAELRLEELRRIALDAAWAVMARLMDDTVAQAIRAATEDADEEVRDSGIEALAEGVGDGRLTAALLRQLSSWDEEPALPADPAADALRAARESRDPWLERLAAYAFEGEEERRMGKDKDERQLFGLLEKVVFLKQVPFFSQLSLDELGRVAEIAEERFHPEGTRIFTQGTANKTMGVVVEGRVDVTVQTPAGEQFKVSELGPNAVYGESSSLYGTLTTASGTAAGGELRILSLNGDALSKLIQLYPGIGIGVLRAAFDRVRKLEMTIASSTQ